MTNVEKYTQPCTIPATAGPPLLFLGMCVYAGSGPLFKKMALIGNHKSTNSSAPANNLSYAFDVFDDYDDNFGMDNYSPIWSNALGYDAPVKGVPSSKITVSPCNVLFVGNLLATVVTIVPFRKDLTWSKWKGINNKQWAGLLTVTFLQSSLARFGELYALAICPSSNIVPLALIGRLEPPLTFILCRFVFHRSQSQSTHAYASNFISTLGVLAALVFVPLATGTFYSTLDVEPLMLTFGATILDAIGTGFSFKLLQDIPVGIYLIVRSGIGAIFFFFVAWGLFGIHHFAGCFDAAVLEYMLIWSGGYILFGNLCWFTGISKSTPLQVSMVGAFYLPMSLVFAFVLVQAVPTLGQYIGAAVIVFACIYSLVCKLREGEAHGYLAGNPSCESKTKEKDQIYEDEPLLLNADISSEDIQSEKKHLPFLLKVVSDDSGMSRSNVQ